MALPCIFRNLTKTQGLFTLSQILLKNAPMISRAVHINSSDVGKGLFAAKCANKNVILNGYVSKRNMSGDHAKLWTAEKVLSGALLAVIPAALCCQSTIMDNLLAVSIVLHQHWGIEGFVKDYFRPIIFGHTVSNLVWMCVYVLSALTLAGLLHLNFNDIGLVGVLKRLWEKDEYVDVVPFPVDDLDENQGVNSGARSDDCLENPDGKQK